METIDIGKIYLVFSSTFSKSHSLRFWAKVPFLPKVHLNCTSSKFTTSFTVLQHSLQLLLHQVWHSRREATVKRLFYNIADEATIYPLNQRAKMGRYGGDFLTKLRGTAPFRPAPRPLILIKRGRSLTKLRSSAPRPSSAPSRGNMPFLKTLL